LSDSQIPRKPIGVRDRFDRSEPVPLPACRAKAAATRSLSIYRRASRKGDPARQCSPDDRLRLGEQHRVSSRLMEYDGGPSTAAARRGAKPIREGLFPLSRDEGSSSAPRAATARQRLFPAAVVRRAPREIPPSGSNRKSCHDAMAGRSRRALHRPRQSGRTT